MKYINDLIEKLLDEIRKLGNRTEGLEHFFMVDSTLMRG